MSLTLILVVLLVLLVAGFGGWGYTRPGGWPYGPTPVYGGGIVLAVLLVLLILMLLGHR